MSDLSVMTFTLLFHATSRKTKRKGAEFGGSDRKEELLQLEHSLQDEQQPEN